MLSNHSLIIQKVMIRIYRIIIASKILRKLLLVFEPETGSISNFVVRASKEIKKGASVLDAGAGSMNYKHLFKDHNYHATDYCQVAKTYSDQDELDFICDLASIPIENETYDVVINIQVLEHVKCPEQVLNELFRVLKKGGKLFLTAPQGWGLHDEPYHYFHFTCYALDMLFRNAGFEEISIKERGGYFRYISVRLQQMPWIFSGNINYKNFIYVVPFIVVSFVLFYILTPFPLFVMDYIDKKRKYTLGYSCCCIKPM